MKQMLVIIAVAGFLGSCTQIAGFSGKNSNSTQVNNTDTLNSVLIRDESITEANAYSDLFLDSSAIESYVQKEKLPDSTASMLRNFYAARNYQFAWFATDGLTEQARGLWSLYANDKDTSSNRPGKELKQKMDTLLQNDSLMVTKTDSSFVQTELALTRQLVRYASANPTATINKRTVYYLVPAKKMDVLQLADSILNKEKDSAQYASNKAYSLLKQELSVYYDLARKGGWGTIPTGGQSLKKGAKSQFVTAIKKRLQATKEYSGTDTSNLFTDSLETAIRSYQQRNGFQPSGIVSDSLISTMNVPVEKRIEQIIVNMNRSLWMQPAADSNQIQVNIPSFMLYAYEGGNRAFEMPVIVGKEGASTVMFHGNINQIVFDPVWTLPASIVRNEILPAMKADPNYLKKHHMEIVNDHDSLPLIRQLPGKDNALGRVKFLFPNSYDIYLHDTPDKTAFSKQERALSHGCIRVADAKKLAQYLLRDQPDWTAEKISSAMSAGREQKITLKNTEPVSITYYTAWVDENGGMNFRNDVYGHDRDAAGKMFLSRP
jgi:murein L,D-transpeptidase YcbB/YkuD